MPPELSVIVPVYKNAATLTNLYERLGRVISRQTDNYEIVFVDDACPAGSLPILRGLAERDARVAVLVLAHNVGQNRAVLTGMAYARGRVAVVMDADLQDPPEAIPSLLAALQSQAAAVFAGRRGRYEPGIRLASSRTLKWLLSVLSRGRLPPDAGLFVAMKREMVECLLDFRDADPYIVGLMGRTGLPLVSIPIERLPAPNYESGYTNWMRLRLAWRALATTAGPLRKAASINRRVRQAAPQVCEYIGARFYEKESA